MAAGTGMSGTGGGAIVGVPVIAGSFALAANGCMTAGHGLAELHQLCREGDPATNVPEVPSAPAPPTLVPKKPATQAAAAGAAPGAKQAASPTVAQQTTSRTVYKDASGKPIKTVTKTGETTTTTTPRVTGKPSATGTTAAPVAKPRGGDSPAAANGRKVHEEFKKKVIASGEGGTSEAAYAQG
jgi:hypothetical protein